MSGSDDMVKESGTVQVSKVLLRSGSSLFSKFCLQSCNAPLELYVDIDKTGRLVNVFYDYGAGCPGHKARRLFSGGMFA